MIKTGSIDLGLSKIIPKCFIIVLARDSRHIKEKIIELTQMCVSYVIVCGEKYDHPRVVYRKAIGKWDAVNYSAKFVPEETDIIIFNDVDTKIHNLVYAIQDVTSKADIVYCKVNISKGPQTKFYKIADPIRAKFHIFASGELLLIKKHVFESTLLVPPCIAEDSYLLFKALELGYCAHFCQDTYVTTKRTNNCMEEELYKSRTTLGIYQALRYTQPGLAIKAFYLSLPFTSLLLMIAGKDGMAWANGIRKAVRANITKEQVTKF